MEQENTSKKIPQLDDSGAKSSVDCQVMQKIAIIKARIVELKWCLQFDFIDSIDKRRIEVRIKSLEEKLSNFST